MAFNKILKSPEARWILEGKYKGKRQFLFWYDMIRLATGYPYAYILGNTPFLSASIDLSYKPFIPREETAFWVTLALKKINEKNKTGCVSYPRGKANKVLGTQHHGRFFGMSVAHRPHRTQRVFSSSRQSQRGIQTPRSNKNSHLSILDIFSGSGAIGIAVAKELPHASVYFIEKNPRFVKQIQKNILLNSVQRNTTVIPFHKNLVNKGGPYHYVFANPPYLSKKMRNSIQKSVFRWEPHQALFATENGLFYIQTLIEGLPTLLFPGGTLFLEHDPWQKAFILQKCAEKDLFAETFLDQYKNSRMMAISRR